MTDLKIISMNCRGLACHKKRRDVFNYLRYHLKGNIYCLQDVHWVQSMENRLLSEWGYKLYFSGNKGNSRGTAILFENNFDFSVLNVENDNEGNYTALKINVDGYDFLLICIYGPNTDSPNFFEKISNLVERSDCTFSVLCGDWNCVLNHASDTLGYSNINNPKARQAIHDIIGKFNLDDVYKTLNPNSNWPTPLKQARLDYFLVSNEMFPFIKSANILAGYRTDHSVTTLDLAFRPINKKCSYWKFNVSLLRDNIYTGKVKETIKNTVQDYTSQPISMDDELNPSSVSKLVISDALFLEVLLMNIRGMTIAYSSWKKKQLIELEKSLIHTIDNLEKNLNSTNSTLLENKKRELENIRNSKMEGVLLRSRARWIDSGEKPTKYFLNLEKRNFINKSIIEIHCEKGSLYDIDDIKNEVSDFYANLYSNGNDSNHDNYDLDNLFSTNNIYTLKGNDVCGMEGEIDESEVLLCLRNMLNNKAPGLDGWPVEFFKFFWRDLGLFVLRSINYCYRNNCLSPSLSRGVITLIPKPGKDRKLIKNWRPITLLPVIYKIMSSCIANRLKTCLPKLIGPDQKGFMQGRYIGENIRLLYDLMFYTENNQIPGLLLSIDFEKAFDSVHHKFIMQVLSSYGFGPSFIRWCQLFLKNASSCVLVNGSLTKFFDVKRGCR